ncbi:MAG TPA: cell division ATP-binding protein FtsE [Candidatus Saccharibacteria bacterium]|jgi:cell division transport system ATP-binding protein|nr:cell division ATP-binding protein FtsE [Candidatus Saccharibacteria bacterium]
MITFDQVTKQYNKKSKALDNVSIRIEPKEFVIMVGTSGAGKSTFLKLLTREEKPSFGKIIVGGIDYDKLPDRNIPLLRRKIGVVFQDFKLLPTRNVFENVAFALEVSGMTNKEIKRTVPKVIELVGLKGKEKSFPHELSGGEQQRVAIARAVVRQPKILVADEPTGNLDPKHSWDIVSILEKINQYGTTVIMTTHNQEIVSKLQRRIINLEDGKVIFDRSATRFKR